MMKPRILIVSKVTKPSVMYLTKWKDHPAEDNSWEPAANLSTFAKDLVRAFNKDLRDLSKT